MTRDRHSDKDSPEQPAIAVALQDQSDKGRPPSVIASGRGAVAEKILEIAFAQGIKVREDEDLAKLLSLVELDNEIPLEAFAAVAEILSYLYRANQTGVVMEDRT